MRHVYLYPTQSLVPQCLALGLYCIKRSSADFGFRVGTSLFLRENGTANADGHWRWTPREREESAGFHHVANKTTRESELRLPKSSCDEAVPVYPNFDSPCGNKKRNILTSPRSRRRIDPVSVRRC